MRSLKALLSRLWLAELDPMPVWILHKDLPGSVGPILLNEFNAFGIEQLLDRLCIFDANSEMSAAMMRVDVVNATANQMQFVRSQSKPCSGEIKGRARQFG